MSLNLSMKTEKLVQLRRLHLNLIDVFSDVCLIDRYGEIGLDQEALTSGDRNHPINR